MHKTTTIQFNGKDLVVNELTVAQIDGWQSSLSSDVTKKEVKPHSLDLLMGKTLPVSVLKIAVPTLTEEDLQTAPSEIEKVYVAVEEMNPFLCGMAERMADLGEAMFALGKVEA